MRRYVLGFAFQGNEVLLCLKKHGPNINLDTWNGVGGKIIEGEKPETAMIREFREETGLLVDNWQHIGHQRSLSTSTDPYCVDIFHCSNYSGMPNLKNDVEESLYQFNVRDLITLTQSVPLAQNIEIMLAHCLWGTGTLKIVTDD